MVKLRLSRFGSKKKPFYRIVAADSRSPRDGRFIEVLGNYDPLKDPAVVNVTKKKSLTGSKKAHSPRIRFARFSTKREFWQRSMLKRARNNHYIQKRGRYN